MNKPPKIDITKSVMSQIESGEVKMRPKAYFTLKKTAKIAGLALIAIALLFAIFYAVVIIQNGVFKEYLEFGKQGASVFWSSMPWGAIVISVLLTIAMGLGIYLVQQKKRLVPSMIGVVAAVALITALVFKISPDPSTNALARAVVGADGNPTKIAGTVEEKNGNKIKVKTSNGEVIIVEIDESTLGDKAFEVGDELLVLGNKQNGSIEADAIKTTKKAEKTAVEVKQQEPTKTEPEAKPVDEPKPENKPTSTAPVITQPTAPSTPPAQSNVITIVSVLPDTTPNPTKYKIKWTSNFPTITGWKIPYAIGSTPSYPGSSYEYISNPGSSSGTVTVLKSTWGSGSFNVRVCAYDTSAVVPCGVYSSIFVVTF